MRWLGWLKLRVRNSATLKCSSGLTAGVDVHSCGVNLENMSFSFSEFPKGPAPANLRWDQICLDTASHPQIDIKEQIFSVRAPQGEDGTYQPAYRAVGCWISASSKAFRRWDQCFPTSLALHMGIQRFTHRQYHRNSGAP